MPIGWRIVKARHARKAFDGEGARRFGGRWNSPGTRMVYTAESPSLTALELLVHLNVSSPLPRYVLLSAKFAKARLIELDRSALPSNWRSYPAPPALQSIGDEWVRSGASLVLKVPSAIIDTESNYLINPVHPAFSSLVISPPKAFKLDLRLLKGR